VKLFYSINELASIIGEGKYDTAHELKAAGVLMTYQGEPADLSRWTGGATSRGNNVYIKQGYYDDPDPSNVLVLTDSLPSSWIRKIKLNVESASSGTPESAELPAPAAEALSEDGPRGLTKKEMLANDWPIPVRINLKRLLSDVPVWLEPARLNRGAPGKASALWNPAMLALCLATNKAISKTALTRYIDTYMSDWGDEWKRLSESL
jgi:hypothetical protein